MAGAPYGNKNAEKWTLEEAGKFFEDVYSYVKENKNCCSISEACSELGWYEKVFAYIQKKYENIDFNPIKKAGEVIKHRIIKKGLENEYNATMSIFILKNNHDMKDEYKNDNKNTNETKIIVQDKKTADQLNKLIDEND
jgi:hypothetical protein